MFTKKDTGLLHSKGIITTSTVAVAASIEVNKRRQPYFLTIRNRISGANAMLCGLVRTPNAKDTAESLGFDAKNNMSERTKKNVYIASY